MWETVRFCPSLSHCRLNARSAFPSRAHVPRPSAREIDHPFFLSQYLCRRRESTVVPLRHNEVFILDDLLHRLGFGLAEGSPNGLGEQGTLRHDGLSLEAMIDGESGRFLCAVWVFRKEFVADTLCPFGNPRLLIACQACRPFLSQVIHRKLFLFPRGSLLRVRILRGHP